MFNGTLVLQMQYNFVSRLHPDGIRLEEIIAKRDIYVDRVQGMIVC